MYLEFLGRCLCTLQEGWENKQFSTVMTEQKIHSKTRLRMCFLKLLRWGQCIIVLYVVEKPCCLTCREDLLVTPEQEHLDRGKIQEWMCEQTEQVLNLSL